MKIGNTLAFYLIESIMKKVKRHYVEYYTTKEERGNRMKENQVKKLAMAAMCVALGIILPMAFHTIQNAGSIFLPMHIPVLICGLLCGWQYGLLCGILAPLLSSMFTGMPPVAILPAMACELAVYGVITGICMHGIRAEKQIIKIYSSLIAAMLAGRIISGILKALIFNVGEYSFKIFITSSFLTGIPGILIQLIFIPVIVLALQKAGITERKKGES